MKFLDRRQAAAANLIKFVSAEMKAYRYNPPRLLISQKEFIKLLFRSQFPPKSLNLLFILVIMKDMLTDLCGD